MVLCHTSTRPLQKRPHLVRLRRADLRRRINGDVAIRYSTSGLTSFAGLELVRQFFCELDLGAQIRRSAVRALPKSDFGVVSMVGFD